MPHEIFDKIKRWQTLELVMLRNLLQHEIQRRMECALIGRPHNEEEIRAYDEKEKNRQAVQRSDLERGSGTLVATDRQDSLRKPEKPKEGPSGSDLRG